tara:strand:- start:56 stop:886 length:831 start_codon:yes stop_codon:yes gene_type:complete
MPKKRGKKTKNIIEPSLEKSSILHLNIEESETTDDKIGSPKPYDQSTFVYKEIDQTISKNPKPANKQSLIIHDNNVKIKKNLKHIMYEFIDSNTRKAWPIKVNTHCMWCCHQFKNIPIAIPQKKKKNVFHLCGIYCSFNCAASHIFSTTDNYTTKWEKYSLLHLLRKELIDIDINKKIVLAPPKETLKMFGGFFDIEEFRNKSENNITYNIIKPPMLSIIPQIEENILNYNKTKDDLFIPLNKDLIKSAHDSLKLKRKNKITKNTLKDYMKLKIDE